MRDEQTPELDGAPDEVVRRDVLRSTLSNYGGQIAALATAFLLTPFILRHVGSGAYGLWVLVTSVVAYGALLDLGISSALIKYVAAHNARGDMPGAFRVTATAVRLYAVAAAIVAGAGAVLGVLAGTVFHSGTVSRGTAAWLCVVIGLDMGLSIPFTAPTSFLRGLNRFDLGNLVIVTRTFAAAALSVAFLLAGGGIVSVAVANLLASVLSQVMAVALARRVAPGFRPGWRGADGKLTREILAFSWSVSLVQVAGRLTNRSDTIVIGFFLPLAAVTRFSLAQRLAEVVVLLTSQFLKVLLPVAAELDAVAGRARLRTMYLSGTRVALALGLPVALVVGILAPNILGVWVGAQYAGGGTVTAILTAAFVVDAITWPAGAVLVAMSRQRPLAWMAIGNGVANVLLSIALVKPYGITGVAIGTLVPGAIEGLLLALPYTMRTLGVPVRRLLTEALLPQLAPTAAVAALLVWVRVELAPGSLAALVAAAAAAGLGYAIVYLILPSPTPEHAFARAIIHRQPR